MGLNLLYCVPTLSRTKMHKSTKLAQMFDIRDLFPKVCQSKISGISEPKCTKFPQFFDSVYLQISYNVKTPKCNLAVSKSTYHLYSTNKGEK